MVLLVNHKWNGKALRQWLDEKYSVLPVSLMPGGFIPRLGAFSLGILLFVNASILSETNVAGSDLVKFDNWKRALGQRCRANSKALRTYEWQSFNGRGHRELPYDVSGLYYYFISGNKLASKFFAQFFSVSGGDANNATGNCFLGLSSSVGNPMPLSFCWEDAVLSATVKDAQDGGVFVVNDSALLRSYTRGDNLLRYAVINATYQPNLVSPNGLEDYKCFYQCATWRVFDFKVILDSSTKIFAGAGIVTLFTEFFSKHFGLPFVSEATTPNDFSSIHRHIDRVSKCWRCETKDVRRKVKMRLGVALLLWSFYLTCKFWLIRHIDSDGMYTVDYYVTFALTVSVMCCVLLRSMQLYEGSPCLYTQKLWAEGKDEFIVLTTPLKQKDAAFAKVIQREFKKVTEIVSPGGTLAHVVIDLYQWIHIPRSVRTSCLSIYARRPNIADRKTFFRTLVYCLQPHEERVTELISHTRLSAMGSEVSEDEPASHPRDRETYVPTVRCVRVPGFSCGLLIGRRGDEAMVVFKLGEISARSASRQSHGSADVRDIRSVSCLRPCFGRDTEVNLDFLQDRQGRSYVKDSMGSSLYTNVINDEGGLRKLKEFFQDSFEDKDRDTFEIAHIDPKFLVEASDKWDELRDEDHLRDHIPRIRSREAPTDSVRDLEAPQQPLLAQ